MTLERIFTAALRDMERGRAHAYCGEPIKATDDPLNDVQWAEGYSEPGYDDPRKGILLANWNQYPHRLTDILKKAGYAIEWSDEWSTCDSCNKLVRTSANSYGWRRSFYMANDCEIICANCVKDDPSDYVESYLLNDATHADTFDLDLATMGFTKANDASYENGWHPGQNDDPHTIAEQLPADHDFVFQIPYVGQFDVSFDVWIRPQEQE